MTPTRPQLYVVYAVAAISVVLLAPYAGCHLLTTSPQRLAPVVHEKTAPDMEQEDAEADHEATQPTLPPITKDLSEIEQMLAE